MRALVATGDPAHPIRETDVAPPVPAADELVVEVAAFSINRGEMFLLDAPTPRPGWRPGKDVAGRVLAGAADGSGPPPGTRVIAHPESGGWAQRVAVPTDRVAPLPQAVSFVEGAALPLAGLTALRLTRVTGPLAGARVLLTGASGGVGHAFTELAAAHGARVTAVSASPSRGARLRELGAEQVVASIEAAGEGYDVAIESVGGASTVAAWHRLRGDGRLIWLGQAGGVAPQLDFLDWDGATSVTIRKFDYTAGEVSVADDLATLARLTAAGRLHPELGSVEDWSRTNAAFAALRGRTLRGNAILTIGAAEARPLAPREVITRYVAAINAGDGDAIAASFAEDAVWRLDGELPISGVWEGRDAILDGFFARARTVLEPGSTEVEVTETVVEGDRVAMEWNSRARTAEGQPYRNRCAAVFTVRDGRIHRVHEYMDTHLAMVSTGVIA